MAVGQFANTASIPETMRHLRSCLRCKLIKTCAHFQEHGCESAAIFELVSFLLLSLDFVFHGSFPSLMSYRCLFCSLLFRALHMIRSQCQASRCSSERQQRG